MNTESPDTPLKPIEHPSVWIGNELLSRPDGRLELTARETAELESAAERTASTAIESLTAESFRLPSLGLGLRRLRHHLEHGSGAVMLRGHEAAARWARDPELALRIFYGLCAHLGTPLTQSAAGEKIFSVRDAGYAEGDPRARGPNTAKRLSFHTDRCDVIAFFCVRQARSGGENLLVSSPALYNRMLSERPDLLRALLTPYPYKRHTVDTANERAFCRQPIFSFCEGHFACAYLRVLIDRADADPDLPSMTDAQREAADHLETLAEDPAMHVRFRQEPGDILLLNNWVTLHRRTAFEDHDDPDLKRHILRIWLSMPNSRPLDPAFAENYGATAAGALRGGMRAATC